MEAEKDGSISAFGVSLIKGTRLGGSVKPRGEGWAKQLPATPPGGRLLWQKVYYPSPGLTRSIHICVVNHLELFLSSLVPSLPGLPYTPPLTSSCIPAALFGCWVIPHTCTPWHSHPSLPCHVTNHIYTLHFGNIHAEPSTVSTIFGPKDRQGTKTLHPDIDGNCPDQPPFSRAEQGSRTIGHSDIRVH